MNQNISCHLIDFNNIQDINFENIIIGRRIATDNDSSKYYIYYQDIRLESSLESPKEIYLRLPRLRLIYPLSNQKYSQVKIPIYPNWDVTNNFIEKIREFENNIFDCFQQKKINKDLSSLISKKNSLFYIKANLNDNVKLSSNMPSKLTLNDLKINGQVEFVLKISYIWTNQNKLGLSSQIYQIKYNAPPEQLDFDFIDEHIPKKPIILSPPNLPKIEINNTSNMPPQLGMKMIPSIKDLQNAIKSLKSSKND